MKFIYRWTHARYADSGEIECKSLEHAIYIAVEELQWNDACPKEIVNEAGEVILTYGEIYKEWEKEYG